MIKININEIYDKKLVKECSKFEFYSKQNDHNMTKFSLI